MASPSLPTIKRLYAVSGNRCAFPKCTVQLVEAASGKVTGRVAHIKARKPGGPRYDAAQSEEQRHGFDNLLLLCPTHHDVVDDDPDSYTVERLNAMKSKHESAQKSLPEPGDAIASQFLVPVHASSGATVVISHNQTGGVTAGTVNINAAPEPTLQMRELFANKPVGNEYHTRVELRVESPYPPANLYVAVRAPSLRQLNLSPQRSGMVVKGHCGTREGWAFENLQQPSGVILLDAITLQPENFRIEWDIQ